MREPFGPTEWQPDEPPLKEGYITHQDGVGDYQLVRIGDEYRWERVPTLTERVEAVEKRLDVLFPMSQNMFLCEHPDDGSKCIWCKEYAPYSARLRKRMLAEKFQESLLALSVTLNMLLEHHFPPSDGWQQTTDSP